MKIMEEKLGNKLAEGRTAEIFVWGADWVVKLFRPGWGRGTVEYEYNQAVASQMTGYRVPQVQQMVEIDGRFGIVYERVEGQTMLEAIRQKPFDFVDHARQMADLHLDMHSRQAKGLEASWEILTWKINKASSLSPEIKEKVLTYLYSLPQENKLLHGDFHPDNIILTQNGPVIIDWVDGNVGHPLADVARTYVIARVGIPPNERFNRIFFLVFLSVYLQRYFKANPYKRSEFARWILPVAAGRLAEEIPHEISPLTQWVDSLVKRL
jgi:uncharacterized protein (TIGR02172 family)